MIDEGFIEAKESSDPLANVRVGDVMTPGATTVSIDMTLLEAVRAVAGSHHRFYPVTGDDGALAGVLSREVMERAPGEQSVRESLERPALIAVASEPVIELVRRMQLSGADRAPVIADEQTRKVVGFVSPADLLRARLRQTTTDESPFEIFE